VLKADAEVRAQATNNADTKTAACKWANDNYPDNYGTADPDNFVFPIGREEAKSAMALAMKHLEHFGEFQDAVSPDVAFGYHSVLSAALNVGLISPAAVVAAAVAEFEAGRVPLASAEAFIRQIIGWREYVHSVYVREADAHRQANYFGGVAEIPPGWYTATTGINLVDSILRRVDRYAYAHHIERLMYLCAVLNMMGCRPTAIHDWFMEMVAIDAYDWVMVPNITMGTYRLPFSSGQAGQVNGMTKHPYFSSYAYVAKMSGEKDENDKAIWDGLYYAFLRDHADLHKKNYFTAKQLRLVEFRPG
jgi:deoxyribodipyrimidine photolyase-related protein